MDFHSRLKRLENKLVTEQEICAVFMTKYYESEDDKRKTRDRLLDEYLSAGEPKPSLSIFLTDFGGTYKEGFVYSFRPSLPRSYARKLN